MFVRTSCAKKQHLEYDPGSLAIVNPADQNAQLAQQIIHRYLDTKTRLFTNVSHFPENVCTFTDRCNFILMNNFGLTKDILQEISDVADDSIKPIFTPYLSDLPSDASG